LKNLRLKADMEYSLPRMNPEEGKRGLISVGIGIDIFFYF